MQKKGFTIIEIVIVFLLIFGVTFLILPQSISNTKKAKLISKWTSQYSNLGYVFSVIKTQQNKEIEKVLYGNKTKEEKEKVLIEIIKPYFRMNSKVDFKKYQQFYMDGSKVKLYDKYSIKDMYLTSSNEIIGLKITDEDCAPRSMCLFMLFDVNGLESPNTWGYDIYGINVIDNEIIPLGSNVSQRDLAENCSIKGLGYYCSYYYLIGGKFE